MAELRAVLMVEKMVASKERCLVVLWADMKDEMSVDVLVELKVVSRVGSKVS